MEKIWLAVAIGVLVFANWWGGKVPAYEPPKTFIAPPEDLNLFTFGYNENFSDALWIRVIQDFDVCEQSSAPIKPPRYFLEDKNTPSRCQNAWVSKMLLAITYLTPDFMSPFRIGATMLSVLVDDRDGAKLIFDRGLALHPYDWRLNYQAGYHYMFEILDEVRAAELLLVAAEGGGPKWLYAQSARIMSNNGKVEFARKVLSEAIEQTSDHNQKAHLQKRLNEIVRGQN